MDIQQLITDYEVCPQCTGDGRVIMREPPSSNRKGMALRYSDICDACDGTGKYVPAELRKPKKTWWTRSTPEDRAKAGK